MPSKNRATGNHQKVSNFRLKHLVSIHEDMSTVYTNIIENPEETPELLTEGLTYLLPKTRHNKPKKLQAYFWSSNDVQDPHFHYCIKNIYILY